MKKSSTGATAAKQNEGDRPGTFFRAEPALMLHMISTLVIFMNVQEFMREKVCSVNLGYSDEICEALQGKGEHGADHKFQDKEVEVQKLLGTLMMTRTILENIFPLFLVILIGAWSDKYGRKLPLLFVSFAFMFQNVCLLLCFYFKDFVGGWTVAVVTSLIPGLSGNNACFNMAVFSYVAENSSPEKRTSRTGIAHSMLFLGLTIGLGLGGALAGSGLGFAKIFIFGLILESAVFIYVFLAVTDSKHQVSNKPFGEKFKEIFTTQHLVDAVSAVQKPRPGNTRMKLIILLITHFCCFAPVMGEMTVYFLFGKYKFNWDGAELGFFMTYQTIFAFFGNFITMGLLSHLLKLSDPAVGICGGISTILASIFYATASSSYLMYFGPIINIFSAANMIIPRSILSKIIPTKELGKVNSFLGCIDSVGPLIAGPVYAFVYTHTFESFPGGFFLLTAMLSLFPIMGYSYFLKESQVAKRE